MKLAETKKKVEVFILSDGGDRILYESIMNNPKITIYKEEFAYDRNGQAIITVWYEVEEV